jgi:hypothetical protein
MIVPPVRIVPVVQPPPDFLTAAFQVTLLPAASSTASHFTGYTAINKNADYIDFNAVFWFLGFDDDPKTMNALGGKISRYAHSSQDSDGVWN